MATQLGEAFVKVTTRLQSLRAGLFDANKMVATAARNMGATLSVAVSVPLALMAKKMIEFSGEAEDSEAKFRQVMGNMSDSVRRWSQEMNRAIDVSEFVARDVAADFASILKGSELSTEAAAGFSTQLVELATDMRAFRGGRLEDALTAIRSGLSGIVLPLKKFGIDITGLSTSGDKAADSVARLDEIFKRANLAGIIGQAAREAETFSGTMLRLRANLRDISTIFGQAFLPAVTSALKLFNKIVGPVVKFAGEVLKATKVTKFIVGALGALLIIAGPIMFFLGQMALSYLSIKVALVQLRASTDRYTASVGVNTAAVRRNVGAQRLLIAATGQTVVATTAATVSTGFFSRVLTGVGLAGIFKWIGGLKFLGVALRGVGIALRTVGKFIFGPWGLAIFLAIDLIAVLWSWLGKTEKQAKATGKALTEAAAAAAGNFTNAISRSGLAAIGAGGFAAAFAVQPAALAATPTASGGKDIPRKTLGDKLDQIDNTLQQMPMKMTLL